MAQRAAGGKVRARHRLRREQLGAFFDPPFAEREPEIVLLEVRDVFLHRAPRVQLLADRASRFFCFFRFF